MASRKEKKKRPALCTRKGRKDSRHRLLKGRTVKKTPLWIKWLWAYYCAAQKVAPKNTKSLYSVCMKKASGPYKSKIAGHKFDEHDLKRLAEKEVEGVKWHSD